MGARRRLKIDEVSVEDHFFDDMGATSLLMAQFCNRLRETGLVADVSMRDTYMHPTIRALAAHLETASAAEPLTVGEPVLKHHASRFAYISTGIAQVGAWLGYLTLTAWLAVESLRFITAGSGLLDYYLRTVAATAALTLALAIVPVAAKWLLVGRWKAERFPVWGVKYFRFWLVKQLLQINPMQAFVGTPLESTYLRLLGAKIGRGTAILSRAVPVATDLVSIGDGAVVSKDSLLSGYRVRGNMVELGPVSIGANAFVGEATVLDIDTAMGEGTQLGNTSSLWSGQVVPDGRRYHGSPR